MVATKAAVSDKKTASFLIGADPELFLRKGEKFISVEDRRGPMIPGTKKKPYEVRGGAVQVDGVAAEFNIVPAKSSKDFIDNTYGVVKQLKDMIIYKDREVKLVPTPTAYFDRDYFDNLPEHTLELGCDPDFNAWKNGEANPRPQTKEPFRTGSGHIHIGWYNIKPVDPRYDGHIKDCCLVVKQLDKFLLFASQDWDNDEQRRKLYGQKGSFRPKSFGVEYRPLSNAWLKDPKTALSVYAIALGTMRMIDDGKADLENLELKAIQGRTNTERVISMLSRYIPEMVA